MYALVYAPYGIVGEESSSVRLYNTYAEAYKVMHDESSFDPECGDDTSSISEWHATSDVNYPDSQQWHIYEVLSPAMRSLAESISLG